jgi:hypothetical protein
MKTIKIILLLIFTAAAASSCFVAVNKSEQQKTENQYVIKGDLVTAHACALKMLDSGGFKPYTEYKKPIIGDTFTMVTGSLSASKPFNKFVSKDLRRAVNKSGKPEIYKAELKKTILIKARWDAAGEKTVPDELGVITAVEFTARDEKGNVIDSWVRNNQEPERTEISKSLEKMISKTRSEAEK